MREDAGTQGGKRGEHEIIHTKELKIDDTGCWTGQGGCFSRGGAGGNQAGFGWWQGQDGIIQGSGLGRKNCPAEGELAVSRGVERQDEAAVVLEILDNEVLDSSGRAEGRKRKDILVERWGVHNEGEDAAKWVVNKRDVVVIENKGDIQVNTAHPAPSRLILILRYVVI